MSCKEQPTLFAEGLESNPVKMLGRENKKHPPAAPLMYLESLGRQKQELANKQRAASSLLALRQPRCRGENKMSSYRSRDEHCSRNEYPAAHATHLGATLPYNADEPCIREAGHRLSYLFSLPLSDNKSYTNDQVHQRQQWVG